MIQMGARWLRGQPPHRSVPPSLFSAITAQEARFAEASSWTLTWLEGRPRAALDQLVVVTVDASGVAKVEEIVDHSPQSEDEDDGWLS